MAQHEPIVEALLAGDPDRAEREAKRHNFEEGALLVEQLRRNEEAQTTAPTLVQWPRSSEDGDRSDI